MRKRIIYTLLISLAIFSCQKDEIMTFDPGDSGVVFPGLGDGATYKGYNTADKTYHVNQSFLNIPLTQETMIVDLPVRVSGDAADIDRTVAYKVVQDLTTATSGTQYNITEAKIPAGEHYGYIRFELFRDAALDNSTVKVTVELENSDDLKVGSNEYKLGSLNWTNMLPMFPVSANYVRTYNCILLSPIAKTSTSVAYYSPNAHKAILDALGWPVSFWPTYSSGLADPTTGVSPMFGAYYSDLYAQKLQTYLDAYAEANNGERLRHNAGTAIGVVIQARVTGAVYNPNL